MAGATAGALAVLRLLATVRPAIIVAVGAAGMLALTVLAMLPLAVLGMLALAVLALLGLALLLAVALMGRRALRDGGAGDHEGDRGKDGLHVDVSNGIVREIRIDSQESRGGGGSEPGVIPTKADGGTASGAAMPAIATGNAAAAGGVTAAQTIMQSIAVPAGSRSTGIGMSLQWDGIAAKACAGTAASATPARPKGASIRASTVRKGSSRRNITPAR